MITLYLNHFRGFEDTFIPLDDVTFLVGENSTGKTSVLVAVRVLGGGAAWIMGRFQVGDEVIGGFADFASNGDEWFQVGYFNDGPATKDRYDAALLTFTGRGSSVPRVMDVRLLSSHTELHFHCDDDNRLVYDKRPTAESIESSFRAWTKMDPSIAPGLPVLDYDSDLTPYSPQHMISALNLHESAVYGDRVDAATQAIMARKQAMDDWLEALSKGSQQPEPIVSPLPTRPERPLQFPLGPTIWIDRIHWLAPIRAKPRRSYDSVVEAYSPEGDHIPWRLRGLPDRSALREALQGYGARSGLYDDVDTRKFGDAEDAPFELRVRLGERTPNLVNVGYGVSQVLPVVTSVLDPTLRGAWFALQQPEVHLHPRAQAALGEMLFDMALDPHNKRFLVETHSDYVIDRFRFRMRKAPGALRAQVLFFERIEGGNVVHRLPLGPDGEYPEEQPEAFRAFFLAEQMQNLGY